MEVCLKNAGYFEARLRAASERAGSPLKNLNNKAIVEFKAVEDPGSSSSSYNLTGLKRGGVPRLQLYTDPTLKKAMEWGVQEWLVQVCIREYGEYTVKGQINRIYQIPEGYFKPQYGPIPQQRGRLFNVEMKRLKENLSGQTLQNA